MPAPFDLSASDLRVKNRFLAAQRRNGLGEAGAAFLDQNYDPRFQGLSGRNAQAFQANANAATGALGADSGSLAARANPFDYGSRARSDFGGVFNNDTSLQFDDMNHQTDQDNQGMMRRRLYGGLTNLGGTYGSGT